MKDSSLLVQYQSSSAIIKVTSISSKINLVVANNNTKWCSNHYNNYLIHHMNVEMQTPNTKWCYDECKDIVYWSNINLVVANRYNHYNNYLIHNTNGEIKSNINLVVTNGSQKRQSCNFLIPSLSSHINLADAAVMQLPISI
jgi:hypothetical protein